MSGRKRILIADITLGNAKGKALGDALAKALNQDEKSSSYASKSVAKK